MLDSLKGPWEGALFLTYSFDAQFFETVLWNRLPPECRRRIVLTDGDRYEDECMRLKAGQNLVCRINQQYLAAGIYNSKAAHSKAILLTSETGGRLLVGSGNSGMQGYASEGELFTLYEYSEDEPENLNAFLAIKEHIDRLSLEGYLPKYATESIGGFWESAPWLYRSTREGPLHVRDNMTESFLEQVSKELEDEAVKEVYIHSPFYDKKLTALSRLCDTLKPESVVIYVQKDRTSIDGNRLNELITSSKGIIRVKDARLGSSDPYIHAKLYIFKTSDRAVCIQGSPNMSIAAFLSLAQDGNIEVASFIEGDRDAFNPLISMIQSEDKTAEVMSMGLSYLGDDRYPSSSVKWRLTGGSWVNNVLRLDYIGSLPQIDDVSLLIGDEEFALDMITKEGGRLEVNLGEESAELLKNALPVSLIWHEGGVEHQTNPVYVCNQVALEQFIAARPKCDSLGSIWSLDFSLEDIGEFLIAWSRELIIDDRSVLLAMGKHLPSSAEEIEGESLYIKYEDIDYEAIKKHPKFLQYSGKPGGIYGNNDSTPLKIMLNGITGQFRSFSTRHSYEAESTDSIDESLLDLEEEEESEEREARRQNDEKRAWNLVRNFMQRFINGIKNNSFQEAAGPAIVTKNFVLFGHFLGLLLTRDWVEQFQVISTTIELWSMFWGKDGYYSRLEEDEKSHFIGFFHENYGDSQMLACLYIAAYTCRVEENLIERMSLRDFARGFLVDRPFEVTKDVMELSILEAEYVFPFGIATEDYYDELTALIDYSSEKEFRTEMEERYGFEASSIRFDIKEITRCIRGKEFNSKEQSLFITQTGGIKKELLINILRDWMRFDDKDYFRIAVVDKEKTTIALTYEVEEESGLYIRRGKKKNEETVLKGIKPAEYPWHQALDVMFEAFGT